MKNTKYYVDKLKILKNKLVDNLNFRNIQASNTEGFGTLIPKVSSITTIATNKQQFPDFSFAYCDLSEEDLNTLFSLIELTNPSSDIKGKFREIPNLKNLSLSDIGITKITTSDSTTFQNTPLEYLDLRNITLDTYTVFVPSMYTTTTSGTSYPATPNIPKTIKEIDLTSCVYNSSYFGFYYLTNLEEIKGLNTINFTTPIRGLYWSFYKCNNLKQLDLSAITLDPEYTGFNQTFYDCINLEYLQPPKNISEISFNTLGGMFYHCDKLSWETIKNFVSWDTIDLTNKSISNFASVTLPKLTKEQLDNLDYTTIGLLRTIDKIELNNDSDNRRLHLKSLPQTPFAGCRINEFEMKNIEIAQFTVDAATSFHNFFGEAYSYYEGPTNSSNSDRYYPATFVDKLVIHDCNLWFRHMGQKYYLAKTVREQILDIKNTNLMGFYYNSIGTERFDYCYIQTMFSGWSFKEIDLSTVTFGHKDITSLQIESMFNGCNACLEKFIGPDLTNVTYKISSTLGFLCSRTYSKLKYFDISKVPLDSISALSFYYVIPYMPNATFVSIGPNLGKGYTQKQSNHNYHSIPFLKDNAVISKDCIIDLFNKLYDLNLTYDVANGGTLYTQKIDLHADVIAQLTPDEIAIVTNKGWTVS